LSVGNDSPPCAWGDPLGAWVADDAFPIQFAVLSWT